MTDIDAASTVKTSEYTWPGDGSRRSFVHVKLLSSPFSVSSKRLGATQVFTAKHLKRYEEAFWINFMLLTVLS